MKKGRRLIKTALVAAALLLPAILLRMFTTIYPFMRTIYLSFRDYDIVRGTNSFVGLANYLRIPNDIVVNNSIIYTVLFVILSTFGEIVLGLIIALILNMRTRFQKPARVINLIPWAIAPIAGALVFRWLFDAQFGMISLLPQAFSEFFSLSEFWGARIIVIIANVWKNSPFMGVVFLASMQSIPAECYEAAKIDGANSIQLFSKITLPMIKPMILTMAVLFTMWQLASFDIIYGMTGGGPGYATEVLSHRVYITAFGGLNFGYASAIGIVLFLIVLFVGVIGFTLWRKQEITL